MGRDASNNSKAEATGAVLQVDSQKEYAVSLSGKQIICLINLIEKSDFKGSEVFLVGNLLTALQDPLLADAHGVDRHEEESSDV